MIVINMVDSPKPNDLCKWALMLERQQQEKLVEEIELSEPNPEGSEEGEDEGPDDAEDIVVVSPTRGPRETMDVDMEIVIEELVVSLEDIGGLLGSF